MRVNIFYMLFLVLSTISYAQTSLSDSLQLYYPFNGNALDESGKGHDGIVVNATLVSDRFGNESSAYEFDGYNDYILCESTFDYVNRSVSLWIDVNYIYGYMPHNPVAITQDDFRLQNGLFRLDFEDGGINLYAGGISNVYHDDGFQFVENWSHFVLIRDTNYVYYYVNAQLVFVGDADDYGSTYNPSLNLVIGAGRTAGYQFFNGKIDDVRIYNRVLSQEEIDELFNSSSPAAINNVEVQNISTGDIITFNFKNNQKSLVRVIDIAGRVQYEEVVTGGGTRINKNRFNSGLYIVQVINNNKVKYSSKIVVN